MFHSNDFAVAVFVVEVVLFTDEGLNRHFMLIEFLSKAAIGVSHLYLANQA